MESYRGRNARIDADTATSPDSIHAAYLAAGAVTDAVDAVMTGEHRRAFALVRPPGHHAEPQSAMGFCFFNSIAVGAGHAVRDHGCERVLIVDWDVHHGNGTQAAFEGRADVLFISLHQFPFYPGTGALLEIGTGPGEGYTINVPLPSRCTDGDYRAAFRDVVAPIAHAFDPDLVMVSAGFDAHRLDPLASMHVTEEGFADMAATVRDLADRHADGRLVLTLEGGYDLGGLGRSVRSVVDVLTGTPAPGGAPNADRGARVIERVVAAHRDRWDL
jgi:acetoin utilization deacetylase AcuC-like enzyme